MSASSKVILLGIDFLYKPCASTPYSTLMSIGYSKDSCMLHL
jgi:hypothetical protein